MQRDNVVKLLLFDLDGTLLKTDKTISERTLSALRDCKNKGYLIGISTVFLNRLTFRISEEDYE